MPIHREVEETAALAFHADKLADLGLCCRIIGKPELQSVPFTAAQHPAGQIPDVEQPLLELSDHAQVITVPLDLQGLRAWRDKFPAQLDADAFTLES